MGRLKTLAPEAIAARNDAGQQPPLAQDPLGIGLHARCVGLEPVQVAGQPEVFAQGEHDRPGPHAVNAVHVSARARRALGIGEAAVCRRRKAPPGRSDCLPADCRHRQTKPLVQTVGRLLVHAHQVQRAEDQVGLGGQDAVRVVVEMPLAVVILDGCRARCHAPRFHWAVSLLARHLDLHRGSNSGFGIAGRVLPGNIAPTAPSHVCSGCWRVR